MAKKQKPEKTKTTANTLQAKLETYRPMLEVLPDAAILFDKDGCVRYVNPEFTLVFGWELAELEGKQLDFVPEENKEETRQALATLLKEEAKPLISRRLTKEGRIIDVQVNANLLKDEQDNAIGSVIVIRDITQHKETERALQAGQDKYRQMLESTPDAYYEVDLNGNITFFSKGLADVLGYPADELLGLNNRDYMDEENANQTFKAFNKVFESGEPRKAVLMHTIRKNGSSQILETSISLRRNAAGEAIGFRGIARDVTERAQAEDALAEVMIEQERMAAQLETVAKISTAVSTILEPQEMLQAVVDLMKDNFELYHAHIYLLNEAGDALELTAGAGKIGRQMVSEERYISLAQEQSLVARAARDLVGVIVNNVEKEPGFLPHALLPDTQSEMAIPMIAGDEVLGVVDMQSDRINHFTRKDINIQTTLATQIAVALQNTRQFVQTQRSEEKYRTILENIEDGYFEVDLRGTFAFANEQVCEMTGYEYDELIGLNYRDYMKEDVAQQVFEGFNNIYKTGEPKKSFDYEIIHKDGHALKINSSVGLIKNAHGEPVGFRGIMRDITKRLEAEEELQKFKLGIERSTSAIFMTDPDGNIVYVNPAFTEIYGYAPEEALGQTPRILKSGLIPQEQYQYFWQALLNKEVVAGEIVNKTKEGQFISIEGHNNPIIDEKGELIGFLSVHNDITKRKQAEETILQQREFFSQIIDSMPLGLFAKDVKNDYRFTIWNKAMEKLFGVSQEEMIGKTDYDLAPKKDADYYRETDISVMVGNELVDIAQEEIQTADGRRLAHTIKIPMYDSQGEPETLVGIIEDVTERIKAEEALKDAHQRAQDILEAVTTPLLISQVNDGKIQYANNLLAEMIGISLETLLEKGTPDFYVRVEDRTAVIGKIREEGSVNNYELELKRANGEHFWALLSARLFNYQNEAAILTTLIDITERKKAQENIARQAAIMDNAKSFMGIGNLDGTIAYVNRFGANMLGYSDPQEVVGKTFAEFQPEATAEFEQIVIPTIMETGVWRGESEVHSADGRITPVDMTVFFLRDEEGQPIGTATNMIDITERKQTEALLLHQAEVEKLGRDLSARFLDLSHEQVDAGIIDALRKLGEFAQVDRAYLFKLVEAEDGTLLQNTHEWCADEIDPQIDHLQAIPYDDFPFFKKHMERQDVYYYLHVADMPAEAAAEKAKYEADNVQSIIIVPLVSGGQTTGFIGFDAIKQEKIWDETDIGLLHLVSDIMVSTFARQQASIALAQALDESEQLYEMSTRLNKTSSVSEIIDAAVVPVVGAGLTAGNLFTLELDENGRPAWMTLVADWTAEDSEIGPTVVPVGTRFNLNDIPTAQKWIDNPNVVMLTGDVEKDETLDDLTRGYYQMANIKASATMPLRTGNKWVGLLTLSWQDTKEFTEDDSRLYRSLAEQTAIMLNNQLLFDQTQQRAAELATVAEVGAAITTIRDVNELLQKVVDLTKERFDLYHAHVYLLDEAGDELVLTSGAGEIGQQMVSEGHSIPIHKKQSLIARAARSKEGLIVNNVEDNPNFLPHPLLPQTKSEMVIPIIVEDKVLGVLDVQAEQINRFSENDVRTKTTLAAQIGVALQNARSFVRSEQAVQELESITKQLRREGWESYMAENESEHLGFQFAQNRLSPLKVANSHKQKKKQNGANHSSQLAKPLSVQGQNIGNLRLEEPETFTDDANDIITAVAERLSAHIENLRLTEQTQRALTETEIQAQRLVVLNEISAELGNATNLTEIYQIAVERSADLLKVDRASILTLLPDGENMEVAAFHGSEMKAPTGTVLPLADSPMALAIEENRLIPGTGSEDIKSVRIVPLIAGGQPFGTLNVGSKNDDFFNERDESLLLQMATLLSSTIENKQLLLQTQARASELVILNEMAGELTSMLEEQPILSAIHEYTSKLMNTSNFYIAFHNKKSNEVTFPLVYEDGKEVEWQSRPFGNGMTEHIIATGNNLFLEEGVEAWLADQGIESIGNLARSWMGVPIRLSDEISGVIALQSKEANAFQQTQFNLLMAVANQAAIALQNARQFQQEQARARREQLLREISARVRSSGDVDMIMRTAVQEIGQTLGRQTYLHLTPENDKPTDKDA